MYFMFYHAKIGQIQNLYYNGKKFKLLCMNIGLPPLNNKIEVAYAVGDCS